MLKSFCAIFVAASAAGRALAAGSGILLAPQGPVQVMAADGTWTALAAKSELNAGSRVRTGETGTALITLSDGSKIALAPNSEFAVGQSDTRRTIFDLAAGKLKAYFAGVFSGRLEVRTPTAVCAVRGTEFEIASGGGKTDVNVAEGHLEVSDGHGHQAVVTSEETVSVGSKGMTEAPHVVSLTSPLAQAAARPIAVQMELAKAQTRAMIEDLRNRELKANEAQLGKSVIDAFGNRVRLEEYLLRPANNQFELLFLASRAARFDWGHVLETFHGAIPNDITQVPAIVAGTFLSKTQPSNWMTNFEFYATNTADAIKENVALGDPVLINFAGYNGGIALPLWYPKSIDYTQTIYGPGVGNGAGSEQTFLQHQDWNTLNVGLLTWTQSIANNAGSLQLLDSFTLDPTSVVDVGAGGCNVGGCVDHTWGAANAFFTTPAYPGYQPQVQFQGFNTTSGFPSGPGKADYLATTVYPDGTTVTAEKILVSNDGHILDFNSPNSNTFTAPGNYNMEEVVSSNRFQGRNIDVLIAPEILLQKQESATTNPNSLNP